MRDGTYVHLWLIHVDLRQKSNRYCTAIMLQKERTYKGGQERMKKRFLIEIFFSHGDLQSQLCVHLGAGCPPSSDRPTASDIPPQHQALPQHQTILQHQTLAQQQALP
ncbi:unnamed protein product [Rangifer tarandus platyrhynchus]|uniref:Uncharacterized protein n=1 Tax=Rangifer tarandus platyrhynchus TaxID=3082113 RepID=A0ABN8Y5I5_RANTA|nr:unnamed protein product [Rangifer tarandus platyrhynchus]